MAVYCGVCARRLSSAADNGGSFQTNHFDGWDEQGDRIADTCEDCARRLRAAVTVEATRIRHESKNDERVARLRSEVESQRRERERYQLEREKAISDFDRSYRSKRGGAG